MVPRLNSDDRELHKIAFWLPRVCRKMPQKHSSEVLIDLGCKGWAQEHFWKFDFWPIFDHFSKKSLNFIALLSNLVIRLNSASKDFIDIKNTIIMLCYDIIVTLQNLGSGGLSVQYWKRDEPEIGTEGLKLMITDPASFPEIIWVGRYRTSSL